VPEVIPIRGVVYRADIGYGLKPWLVVSNNARNQHFEDCLAVRITTTEQLELPSNVRLGPADGGLVGWVCCDDINILGREELKETLGAISPRTMMKVGEGLRAALALL
jgi:mRNA interferase MazF